MTIPYRATGRSAAVMTVTPGIAVAPRDVERRDAAAGHGGPDDAPDEHARGFQVDAVDGSASDLGPRVTAVELPHPRAVSAPRVRVATASRIFW